MRLRLGGRAIQHLQDDSGCAPEQVGSTLVVRCRSFPWGAHENVRTRRVVILVSHRQRIAEQAKMLGLRTRQSSYQRPGAPVEHVDLATERQFLDGLERGSGYYVWPGIVVEVPRAGDRVAKKSHFLRTWMLDRAYKRSRASAEYVHPSLPAPGIRRKSEAGR